ncbi:hypothetical protein MKW92_032105 [Papaver armeniacum]|nr:hypothetical protein MKW92_032105 [Papaver armeniacum]
MKKGGFPSLTRCASNFPPLVSHTRSSNSHHPLLDDELSISEIFSRLPVDMLMRFKCVCKRWQSLIQKDDHFIDLHHTRSQTRKSLLICPPTMYTYGEICYLLAELLIPDEGSGGGATVHKKIPDIDRPDASLLQPLNGLFCFMDSQEASVCVQNPSTRESTPWIKSIIKQQHEDEGKVIEVIDEHGDLVKYDIAYRNYDWKFGFDPATKEHKVISLWVKQLSNRRLGRSEEWLCEVLTVRQNSWRTIDAVPPVSPLSLACSRSAYANGSIYWLHYGPREDKDPSIVEFNVGSEMFRVIPLPKFIMNDIRVPYEDGNTITEVDGHLVLLAKMVRRSDYDFLTDWIMNNNSSMKMCILYNDDQLVQRKKDTGCGSSTCSDVGDNSNYYWMEDSFLKPPLDWKQESFHCILPIPGTDLMIVRSSYACQ